MLRIENLTAGYDRRNPIIKGINLKISNNEVVAIVGQNGAGKSTLAKAIMNLVPHVSGEIYFNEELIINKDTDKIVKTGLKFFLQGGRIFPNLTVKENLHFACSEKSKKERDNRVELISSNFSLLKNKQDNKIYLKASHLSGGEKYQLALAMLMIQDPKFIILDEPTAGLSPVNIKELYDNLCKVIINHNIPILLIEHNIKFATDFSDKVYLLIEGEISRNETLDTIESIYFNDK